MPVDVEVAAYEPGTAGPAVVTSPLTDQSLIGVIEEGEPLQLRSGPGASAVAAIHSRA
jgi:hypothetical protein